MPLDMTYATKRHLYNDLAAEAFAHLTDPDAPIKVKVFNGWPVSLAVWESTVSRAANYMRGILPVKPIEHEIDGTKVTSFEIGYGGQKTTIAIVKGTHQSGSPALVLFDVSDLDNVRLLTLRPFRREQTHTPPKVG